MSTKRPFTLERFRYWQGQKLLGRDFRDQRSYEAQLRWWHNRALHNVFGIAYGLEVTQISEAGEFSHVNVNCGVAYDCFGRELILQTTRKIALPPDPPEGESAFTLVVSYKEREECGKAKYEFSDCSSSCSCRLEEPNFQWKVSRCFSFSDGVPLAQISYDPATKGSLPAAKRSARVINFLPRLTRAFARPRIGRGATVAGDTAWDPWIESVLSFGGRRSEIQIGVQVTIDTSKAGFTQLPCYFAWLQGSLWDKTYIEFFPVPFSHIDSESPYQFRFRLWMPSIISVLGSRLRYANIDPLAHVKERPPHGFPNEFLNFARRQELYVCWIGIQEQAGTSCEPIKNCDCETAPGEPRNDAGQ
jgi:hypothetical protein